ncbi:MAG: DUF5625 family protein [Sulfuricurvum sp.]|nr:DUF5625 family protein [Sulfuricurvum sp.]
MQNKMTVITMLFIVLMFSGCNAKDNIATPTIIAPFDISKAGNVYETEFEITKSFNWFAILTLSDIKEWHKVHWYTFDISFLSSNGQDWKTDYENLKKIIGDGGRYSDGKKHAYGVPMLLKITITPVGEHKTPIQHINGHYSVWRPQSALLNESTVYTIDLSDRGVGSMRYSEDKSYQIHTKSIVEMFAEEGIYKVRIESLQDIPQLSGRKTNIEIRQAYHGK